MDYLSHGITIVLGLCLLLAGGELLVRGASGLARSFRISPLIIGLTVVAFGTSAPELAVVLDSSFKGETDLAIGNVVGSCIFNVLFVLGLTAVTCPLIVSARLVRLEVPLMIGASVMLFLLGFGGFDGQGGLLDGRLGRFDGMLLFGCLIWYMGWTVKQGRKESREFQQEVEQLAGDATEDGRRVVLIQIGLILAGFVLLLLGSNWLVAGSVSIAEKLKISKLIIGLTIIAIGTSLPEIVTSVMAVVRGEGDIAVGNVVGSNIINILGVLGLSSIVAPGGITVSAEALSLDIPVMIAVALACLPIFFTDYRIDRWEGWLFFGYWIAYTTYLIVAVKWPETGRTFGKVLLLFIVPLTILTLSVAVFRALTGRRLDKSIFDWLGGTAASQAETAQQARYEGARQKEKRKRQQTKKSKKQQWKRRKK